MPLRTYTGLLRRSTFEDRYRYLALSSRVGDATFGSERWLNQDFYTSTQWRRVRKEVIARDLNCDMGMVGFDIYDPPHVHHMNPMTIEDIIEGNEDVLNPEYLITVSQRTHNAIHFGDERQLPRPFVERSPGDTLPWVNK